jgi:hypothetical protein
MGDDNFWLPKWQHPYVYIPPGTFSVPKNRQGKRVLIIPNSNVAIRGFSPSPTDDDNNDAGLRKNDTNRATIVQGDSKVGEQADDDGVGGGATKSHTDTDSILVTPDRPVLRSNSTPSTASPLRRSSKESSQGGSSPAGSRLRMRGTNSIGGTPWSSRLNGSLYVWSKSSNVRVTNVSLTSKKGYGVFVQEESELTLANVEISHCGFDGVLAHGERTRLAMIGCSVHHNHGCGLW